MKGKGERSIGAVAAATKVAMEPDVARASTGAAMTLTKLMTMIINPTSTELKNSGHDDSAIAKAPLTSLSSLALNYSSVREGKRPATVSRYSKSFSLLHSSHDSRLSSLRSTKKLQETWKGVP